MTPTSPVKSGRFEGWHPCWDSTMSLLQVLSIYRGWADAGLSDTEVSENIADEYGGRKAPLWVRRALDGGAA